MVIAVGGNRKKAGKTAVICALIRALPEADWTAIKISPHRHGSGAGEGNRGSGEPGDTGRYLQAGARAALLLDRKPDRWPEGNVIVESGSADADLALLVVNEGDGEFKASARAMLARADAIILTGGSWTGGSLPVFGAPPPGYHCPELVELVRRRLTEKQSAG
jgi:hypothetical protein